jgi:hypothetical protein
MFMKQASFEKRSRMTGYDELKATIAQMMREGENKRGGHRFWVEMKLPHAHKEWQPVDGFEDFWDVVRYIERSTLDASGYDVQSYITLLMNEQLRVFDEYRQRDISQVISDNLWGARGPLTSEGLPA